MGKWRILLFAASLSHTLKSAREPKPYQYQCLTLKFMMTPPVRKEMGASYKDVLSVDTVAINFGCRGDIFTWCPTINNDLETCSNLLATSLSSHRSFFTNANKILSFHLYMAIAPIICQNSTEVTVLAYADCVYGKYGCIPSDWRKVYPDVNQVKRSITTMCHNVNDIDVPCGTSTSRYTNLANCIGKKYNGPRPDLLTAKGFIYYACSTFRQFRPCILTAYGTCSRKTAKVLAQLYLNEKLAACDTTNTSTNSDSVGYTSDNSAGDTSDDSDGNTNDACILRSPLFLLTLTVFLLENSDPLESYILPFP